MSINSYKLVPVKMFEDLTKNCQVPVENNRSIKSIIEESESINENSDKYPTVSLPPQMQLGEGRKLGSAPLWIYEDQTTLPIYSQGKKVDDSFESYKNILNNNTIPEHTKIQLLQFLKDKYDDARRPYGPLANIDEDDEDNRDIIHSIT